MTKSTIIFACICLFLFACNWKTETTYTTKYRYFLTKRDLINDSLVKELCGSTWTLFQFENRKFNKQKMIFNDSREWIEDKNAFKINFFPDSTITTQNPNGKGSWSINNQYFLEFDFTSADTSNHLQGKFDVKMRYDDLLLNKGIYTNDTSTETVRFHFFRNSNEIKIF